MVRVMVDFGVLDHPIWGALTSTHASLAQANGDARRYPRDVSPLAALLEPRGRAFDDLVQLVKPEEDVALFTDAPIEIPAAWSVVRSRFIDQMVCAERIDVAADPRIVRLGYADVPEMLALTGATKPGPFADRTIEMGRYFGIRAADGRLMSMAGERLKLAKFTEVSAVCTWPEYRGMGLSKALIAHVAGLVFDEGKTPFLHVKTENTAKRLYEQLGFRVRMAIQLTVMRKK